MRVRAICRSVHLLRHPGPPEPRGDCGQQQHQLAGSLLSCAVRSEREQHGLSQRGQHHWYMHIHVCDISDDNKHYGMFQLHLSHLNRDTYAQPCSLHKSPQHIRHSNQTWSACVCPQHHWCLRSILTQRPRPRAVCAEATHHLQSLQGPCRADW